MTTGINTVEIVTNPVTVDVDNDNKVSVNVTETKAVLEIGVSGPQGPQGEPGSIGTATVAYTHIQSTPASTWTINHSLSFYPNITVVDSAGSVVEGSVDYQSATVIVVNFSGAFSGKAYLS